MFGLESLLTILFLPKNNAITTIQKVYATTQQAKKTTSDIKEVKVLFDFSLCSICQDQAAYDRANLIRQLDHGGVLPL